MDISWHGDLILFGAQRKAMDSMRRPGFQFGQALILRLATYCSLFMQGMYNLRL
jgi:hypothetical protein